jgi:hypothetical protein
MRILLLQILHADFLNNSPASFQNKQADVHRQGSFSVLFFLCNDIRSGGKPR